MELGVYVESLYHAETFEDVFAVFDKEVKSLGFDAVLYTLIPKIVVDQCLKPIYAVSEDYCPEYLTHYQNARFDRHDPLIKAVSSGESKALDWQGPIVHKYTISKACREVFDTAFEYGIRNGITIPLMTGAHGLAGASFISHDTRPQFLKLLHERQSALKLRTELFHNLVVANAQLSDQFTKPVIDVLNSTERTYLTLLAAGRTNQQIATELSLSEKYLEQVMLRLRRKLSGVGQNEIPRINRNQILFYAGLLNIFNPNRGTGIIEEPSTKRPPPISQLNHS